MAFDNCILPYNKNFENVIQLNRKEISNWHYENNHYITRASLIAQLVKNPPAMQETPDRLLGQEDPLEKGRLLTSLFLGFPCDSAGKESVCNAADLGSIPGLERTPGEGNATHSSILAWRIPWTIVHGVAKSLIWLSHFHYATE